MNRLTIIAKTLLDKDTRSLVKSGILNKDLSVGKTEMVLAYTLQYLLETDAKFKKGLAAIAEDLIEESESDCSC